MLPHQKPLLWVIYTFTGFYGMAYQHSAALMGRSCLLETLSRVVGLMGTHIYTRVCTLFSRLYTWCFVLCPVLLKAELNTAPPDNFKRGESRRRSSRLFWSFTLLFCLLSICLPHFWVTDSEGVFIWKKAAKHSAVMYFCRPTRRFASLWFHQQKFITS